MAEYTKYKKGKPLPKLSKTLPLAGDRLKGNGEDYRKWFTCWNCGFTAKFGRDSLGGYDSRAGVSHQDAYIPSDPLINNLSVLEDGSHVTVALGADGNPKGIEHEFEVIISGGCPLCGSLNWRGDY